MSHRTYFTRALAGLFAAAVGVGIAWLLAAALSPDIYATGLGSDEEMQITLGAALTVTAMYGAVGILAGWLLFWRKKPVSWWYVIVALVLIGTAIEAFALTDKATSAVWLNLFHLIAAACIAPAVAVSLIERSEETSRRWRSSWTTAGNLNRRPRASRRRNTCS